MGNFFVCIFQFPMSFHNSLLVLQNHLIGRRHCKMDVGVVEDLKKPNVLIFKKKRDLYEKWNIAILKLSSFKWSSKLQVFGDLD